MEITIDFDDKLENIFGRAIPEGLNRKSDVIYKLMLQGVRFEIAPSIDTKDKKVVGLSVIPMRLENGNETRDK